MMRKLKADEIECRIAQCFDGKCTALLYKTARVDRAILDETFGNHWQNDFKVIDGKMYGGIGVFDHDLKEWIWRWDCGTESNTEKEKGEASDCFKRAGFKWGIGIELYSAPQIWLNIQTKKNDKGKFEPVNKYDKYDVKEVGYDSQGNINKLIIINKQGNILYSLNSKEKPVKTKNRIELDSDIDIISGVVEIDNIKDLEAYYTKYSHVIKDNQAFISACKSRKEAILKQKGE